MDDKPENLTTVPDLSGKDVEMLLAALLRGGKRVEPVALSRRTVWIKRYGTEQSTWWRHFQASLSRLIPLPYLRPSLQLKAADMAERERRRILLFSEHGVATPPVLYASSGALVLGDVGTTVYGRLRLLRDSDHAAHDDLLVACASELGRLHAVGLCHGRPYPRDMFFAGDRLGFMDFEEDPQTVMPLETAQARDIWLMFLQIASSAKLGRETHDRAYAAWKSQAPAAAIVQLRRMTGFLERFLSFARLIGRVQMGSDLQRFILATDYLKTVSVGDR